MASTARAPAPEPERRFSVYVVRLVDDVLDDPAFRAKNPHHRDGKPCAYVGMTGLSPEERLENHFRGQKSNRFVQRYGKYLMRRKFEHLNPLTYAEAQREEIELAERLRRRGYAVWQA